MDLTGNISTHINLKSNWIIWIFQLLVMASLISQSGMDAFATLLVILFLFEGWRSFQLQPKGFLNYLAVLWVLEIFIGLLLAPESQNKFIGLLEWKWFLLLWAVIWVQRKYRVTEATWNATWITLGLGSSYAIAGWALEHDFYMSAPLAHLGRAGGLFYDPMTFAHSYGQFLCLALGIILMEFNAKKWKILEHRALLLFTTLLCGFAVLVSFTRGIWGSCAIALVVMAFTTNTRFAMKLTALLILIFGVLFFAWPQFHDRIVFVFNFQQNYDGDRVALWQANWEAFKDHPLFGYGYGQYREILPGYFQKLGFPSSQFLSHAHNQYLHFLAGTGILGLLCYVSFAFYGLITTFNGLRNLNLSFRERSILTGAFGAQICFLLGGLTESNFERAKVRLVYLLIYGISVGLASQKDRRLSRA